MPGQAVGTSGQQVPSCAQFGSHEHWRTLVSPQRSLHDPMYREKAVQKVIIISVVGFQHMLQVSDNFEKKLDVYISLENFRTAQMNE